MQGISGIGAGSTAGGGGASARLAAQGLLAQSSGEGVEDLARRAHTLPAAEVGAQFEALFASLLIKEMRRSLPEGFFGGQADGDIYAGWFDQHIGEAIARDGGLGLADLIERNLNLSGASSPASPGARPEHDDGTTSEDER